jgi:LmbE family N-acetylglucosaminyl deacetylase
MPKTLIDFGKEFLRRQRLLVIAPHADDEVIGAGGLISKIKEAGGSVFVMIFSIGDVAHFGDEVKVTPKQQRLSELEKAMKTLKVDDYEVIFGTKHHLKLDTVPRKDLVHFVERGANLSTEKSKPTMIILPAPSYNQDHEAIYKAGITASRPHLPKFKAFQNIVLIADEPQLAWNPGIGFRPNFYVNITGRALETKLEAYSCYKSQIRPPPSNASIEALEFLAKFRGREISIESAEAFECPRIVI